MKGLESSPTSSFRNRLAKKVKVILVPEYYTTKTCSKCLGSLEPDPTRTFKRKDGAFVPLRGIRRCHNEKCGGFLRWNRDYNAAINIRTNLMYYLKHDVWHPSFLSPKR